jgi:hypothetical protein
MPAQRQIAEFERRRHHPGAVAEALASWSARVHGTSRRLAVTPCVCCTGEPVERDVLEEALRVLPPRARTELRPLVARLDALYWKRAVPGPAAESVRWWGARPC